MDCMPCSVPTKCARLWLQDEDASFQLEEAGEILGDYRLQVHEYMAHRLSAVQQACARELHFLDAPAGTAFFMLDYMAKWKEMWHKCAMTPLSWSLLLPRSNACRAQRAGTSSQSCP